MSILSMRIRTRTSHIIFIGLLCLISFIIQQNILNYFAIYNVTCNMPLTLVIVWGALTGSHLPQITPNELRTSNMWQIFLRQLASGSLDGTLTGAFVAALYASIIPIYPVCYALIGWIAGYFPLRGLQKQSFLCIPLVFILTGFAEAITAWQLSISGRAGTYDHLYHLVLPEALLNSIIAPFVYFPIKQWLESAQNKYDH